MTVQSRTAYRRHHNHSQIGCVAIIIALTPLSGVCRPIQRCCSLGVPADSTSIWNHISHGYMSRRCTSNAIQSSATSLGRERDRPVRFSIRRNRWGTILGWQISTSAAPRTDASLSCHTRNVSNSISRSSSGRSPKPSNAAPTVLIIASGALTAAVARMEPSNTATEEAGSVGPRNIILATCRARGVSRRSPKGALTPTRAVVVRDIRATTTSSFWSDLTCTIPTCTSGSCRHAEKMSRLRSFTTSALGARLPAVCALRRLLPPLAPSRTTTEFRCLAMTLDAI